MNNIRLLLAGLLLCTSSLALAQNPVCSQIADVAERMACHEAMPDDAPIKSSENWLVLETKSYESDRINAIATRSAKWRVQCGETVNTATIILNCREGKMQVDVSTACKFGAKGDQSQVLYRVGERNEVSQEFTVATRSSVIQLNDHTSAVQFSKSLLDEGLLHMTLSPPGSAAFTATFEIGDLDEEVGPLRKRCDW